MPELSGRAVCLIRDQPHYRLEAFVAGLSAVGLAVQRVTPDRWRPGDVLVIWNRYGRFAAAADRCEAAGGTVVVAENPYFGTARERYALALDHHKGPGRWFPKDDGGARWRALGLAIEPWIDGGDYVLLAPERGIGPPQHAMPRDWPERADAVLRLASPLPVKMRRHPGTHPAAPLEDDLAGAAALVTWGSTAALKALLAGVPVCHAMRRWIGAECAQHWDRGGALPPPYGPNRGRLFASIAWAQWSVGEIADGAPFRHLLRQ